MRKLLKYRHWALAWALTAVTALAEGKPYTIKDFVKLPDARDLQISPNGEYLSVVFNRDGKDLLAVLERETLKPLQVIGLREANKSVGKVYWANDERLVYTALESHSWNKQRYDNGELFGVNIDGSKHNIIFGYNSGERQTGSHIKKNEANYGNQKILDLMPDDPENILIAFYPWKLSGNYWVANYDTNPRVLKLNVYTGKTKNFDYLPMPMADGLSDNQGNVRFASAVDNNNNYLLFYKGLKNHEWQEFKVDGFNLTYPDPLSFSGDDSHVYLLGYENGGTNSLFQLNLEKGSWQKLHNDETADISALIYDFSGKHVVAVASEVGVPVYRYLDPDDKAGKLHKQLMEAFKGSDVHITSNTIDGKWAIVYVYSDRAPGDYYLFNTETLEAKYMLSQYANIMAEEMNAMQPIQFKARDGMMISGYLTLPKKSEKLPPLVVLPHGGPHGIRDMWQYDWEVQLLTNQGFAVLQVNFRGSGGFGIDYQESGYGNWGTSMQDDITDATHYVMNQKWVDTKRICIYGASYGAYAAIMGVIREPDLYRCAIGSAGVYDLPMMFKEGDIADRENGLAYLKQVLGNNPEDQKQRSPVYHTDKIKTPLLLIHGEKDKRAPIEQAESLKSALDKSGKKYEWLAIGNEAHGYYDEKNRFDVYSKILQFLNANLAN